MLPAVLQRHATVFCLLLAVGATAAAILLDVLTGEPLEIGWTQFFLLVVAAIALLVSPPPVLRALRSVFDRSRQESSNVRARLQRRPIFYLLYSLWLACAISLVEVGLRWYQRAAGKVTAGPDFVWAVPLGHIPLLMVVGVLFYVAGWLLGTARLLKGLVFVSVFAAFTGWLTMAIKGLSHVAAAVFAAGIGFQTGRAADRHAYVFHTLVRRLFVWVATIVASLVVAVLLWPQWRERRAIRALPEASSRAPNVLLIVLDTVRAKSMSLYGYGRETTPNLRRFAGRGVVFERALAPAPWTLPSHASIFTGRFPGELSSAWRTPLDGAFPTLAESLSQQGYSTAGFVANHAYGIAAFGLGRGFIHYDAERGANIDGLGDTVFGQILVDELQLERAFGRYDNFGRRSAAEVNAAFLGWLSSRNADRPYFAFLNYFDAHTPYMSPPEFGGKFSADYRQGNIRARSLDSWSAEDIQRFNNAYDGSIAYIDHQLGALLDALEQRHDLDRTIVIVTADHGEHFGEHRLLTHAVSLYTQLLHVPLLIVYPPRVPAGRRVGSFVGLRDLPATILDLSGAANGSGLPGASLAPYWSGDWPKASDSVILAEAGNTLSDFPRHYPTSKGAMRSIVVGHMHYIKNYGDGREELYDLEGDFDEVHDLAPSRPDEVAEYRARLKSFERAGNPRH